MKVYIIIVLIMSILIYTNFSKPQKLNKCFYTINQLKFGFLNKINLFSNQIAEEVKNLEKNTWHDWPEQRLFYKNTDWKIMPFFGFGHESSKMMQKCPILTSFLKSIPNIKLATLSKIGPQSRLKSHQGWGDYSNNVVRCHYGIDVPYGCFMHVYNGRIYEKKMIANKKWTIFDDSKMHYASNASNKSRIVLIVDIERPLHIKTGESSFNETTELNNFVKQFDAY